MALFAYDPMFSRFAKLMHDMQSQMNELMSSFETEDTWASSQMTPSARSLPFTIAPFDLAEKKDKYVVKMDVPGLTSADLKVTIENGRTLIVTGERKHEKAKECNDTINVPLIEESNAKNNKNTKNVNKNSKANEEKNNTKNNSKEANSQKEEKKMCVRERYYGRFSRSVRLPSNIDLSDVDASVHNGILTVVIKKTADAPNSSRNVPVK